MNKIKSLTLLNIIACAVLSFNAYAVSRAEMEASLEGEQWSAQALRDLIASEYIDVPEGRCNLDNHEASYMLEGSDEGKRIFWQKQREGGENDFWFPVLPEGYRWWLKEDGSYTIKRHRETQPRKLYTIVYGPDNADYGHKINFLNFASAYKPSQPLELYNVQSLAHTRKNPNLRGIYPNWHMEIDGEEGHRTPSHCIDHANTIPIGRVRDGGFHNRERRDFLGPAAPEGYVSTHDLRNFLPIARTSQWNMVTRNHLVSGLSGGEGGIYIEYAHYHSLPIQVTQGQFPIPSQLHFLRFESTYDLRDIHHVKVKEDVDEIIAHETHKAFLPLVYRKNAALIDPHRIAFTDNFDPFSIVERKRIAQAADTEILHVTNKMSLLDAYWDKLIEDNHPMTPSEDPLKETSFYWLKRSLHHAEILSAFDHQTLDELILDEALRDRVMRRFALSAPTTEYLVRYLAEWLSDNQERQARQARSVMATPARGRARAEGGAAATPPSPLAGVPHVKVDIGNRQFKTMQADIERLPRTFSALQMEGSEKTLVLPGLTPSISKNAEFHAALVTSEVNNLYYISEKQIKTSKLFEKIPSVRSVTQLRDETTLPGSYSPGGTVRVYRPPSVPDEEGGGGELAAAEGRRSPMRPRDLDQDFGAQ